MWGPNAAGKTTLLEAIVLLAIGRSHRTTADVELIRWGTEFMRVEGEVVTAESDADQREMAAGPGAADRGAPSDRGAAPADREASGGHRPGSATLDVTIQSSGSARKRLRVNGVPRRAQALGEQLRVVLFAPEEMLLVVGSPSLRREALDLLATQHDPTYASELSTYARALQQRNSLLRAIREGEASRDELRYWDEPLLAAGSAVVSARLRLLEALSEPLAAAHAEIAPGEGRLTVSYVTNAPALPGETPRDALTRRLRETAEKEAWNGTTLVGPHRDDLQFSLDGRDLATFASRGQQRTAILAFKLSELDLLSARDGRPPILLLDDVFSELDPARRAHLVRRISELPQSFVTTTDPADLDPELRRRAHSWQVVAEPGETGEGGARVIARPAAEADDRA